MTAIYRLLLLLYPRDFRDHYGADILRAIVARRDCAAATGRLPLARFHLGALTDLAGNAVGERLGRPGPAGPPRSRRAQITALLQDARFAVRMLVRRPALSFFSAATLALGIGAITVVAGVVDAVLLQPLPFPRSAEIIAIRGVVDGQPTGMSFENLRDLATATRGIAAASPFVAQSVNLTGVDQPDRLRGGFVTSGFFDVIGIQPALGRAFGEEADPLDSQRVAVLTNSTWRTRFGARNILGDTIQLNNAPFTVIGVMPPDFDFPIDEIEVFLPFWTTTAGLTRSNHNFFGLGRLSAAITRDAAQAEAVAAAAHLEQTYPDVNRGRTVSIAPLQEVLTGNLAPPLRLLAAMVALMLLAAAANVGGLQLGDRVAREREIAVRMALGAGRARVVRQLILESTTRAALGAMVGVTAAAGVLRIVAANAPQGVYGLEQARLGVVPVLSAIATMMLAGVAAGLPSAVQWTRAQSLAQGSSRVTADAGVSRLRTVLVVCQVAVAAVLLVAAGLTARSYGELTSVDTGFDGSSLLTMEYRLPRNKYESTEAQAQFHREVVERIEALPGVEAAASVRALPFSGNGSTATYRLAASGEDRRATFNAISATYFETLRIPILAGRGFDHSEGDTPVVVVSRAFADRAWPGEDPIDRQVHFDGAGIVARVIGVVGNVRHADLTDADDGTIYTHQAQNPSVFNTLVVRTAGAPMALADTVRRAVWSLDPDQPVWKIRTLESLITSSTATRRYLSQLVVFFGGSVAALALLGLYGVVASAVAQRTREIGIRVALGATRTGVLRLVLWAGLRPGLIGLALGLGAAAAGAQVLRGVLFGVAPRDPVTFAGVSVMLLAASLGACWVPARRALRLDPTDALRVE